MIKLKDLRADTPTRMPYTKEQILIMVIKGKQWGHTPRRGRQVSGLGKTSIFDSQPIGTYSQLEIDDMLTERDQALAAANAQRRELEDLRSVVRSDTRMAELLSNLGSRSEVGSGSGARGKSGNDGDRDDNEGEDGDTDVDEEEGH
ncbi:hypothetical protein Tco_0991338 [Tanacetum coccineum]|uniref:Uncharacterized protein n=1 Tax=Tanacetum coccineum TaxID=301880 RepID=A0ABQ5F024_9ASTR